MKTTYTLDNMNSVISTMGSVTGCSKSESGNVITIQGSDKDGNRYLGNKVDDSICYVNWQLTGDGEVTVRVGRTTNNAFSSTDKSQHVYLAVMVRKTLASDSEMVAMALKNEIKYAKPTITEPHKFLYRQTVATNPTVTPINYPSLDGIYHGYIKFTRSGDIFSAYQSDDRETWTLLYSYTISLPTSLYYGIAFDPEDNNDLGYVTDLRFKGFQTGCSSAQEYKYGGGGCANIDAWNECGDNKWRKSIIASFGDENNLNGFRPKFTVDSTSVLLESNMKETYDKELDNDAFLFSYKKLSGNGTITVEITELTGDDKAAGGIGLREDVSNSFDIYPVTAICQIPRKKPVNFFYRPTRQTTSINERLVQLDTAYLTGNDKHYAKLIKEGNTISCWYKSTSGGTYTKIGEQNIVLSEPFYGGLTHHSKDTDTTVKFEVVNFEGFKGYCNDHGSCSTNQVYTIFPFTEMKLDNCNCETGYSGKYCQTWSCFGTERTVGTVCSSHGTCTGPNTCSCNTGYTGNECQYFVCNGISGDNAAVCSGNGTCTGIDTCSCGSDYAGNNCQYPRCFGIAGNDANVCSSHGSCTSVDSCSCNSGYQGNNCETPICYGKVEPTSCSSENGTCTQPNTCSCKTGHTGDECQLILCYGIASNNASVCSGNGVCSNVDNCACSSGYTGNECQTPICHGKIDPLACSGVNGTCTSSDTCLCVSGIGGNECQFPICFGTLANNASVCSGHGYCQNPDRCVCNAGYTGNECQTPMCYGKTDPIACSGSNGTCISHELCSCASNFVGNECEVPVCFGKLANDTSVCSSQGSCIGPDTCTCNSEYTGNNCQHPVCFGVGSTETNSVCSGNGTCTSPNNCECNSGYFGNQCNIYTCNGQLSNQSSVCSALGSCIGKEQCFCNSGYIGANCEFNICNLISSNDSTVCSSHGSCTAPDNCVCQSGWTGNNCETFTCADRNSCSGHGSCEGPNNCSCSSQYSGSNCSLPVCYGIVSTNPTVCTNKRGICSAPDTCTCVSAGYSGAQCEESACVGVADCNSNGFCVGANNCSCLIGWKNTNCSTFHCEPTNNCSYPQGSCTGPNTCNCTSQWSGNDCNSPVCQGISGLSESVCSGNGNCTSPEVCQCDTFWSGINCEFASCKGINSTNTSVCNSRGSCLSPNNCTCDQFYDGADCQFTICNGISNSFSSVCSSHGSCISPNVCNCSSEYDGNDCQFPICYGKSSNISSSCTSIIRGSCVSPNNCSCNAGYAGNECQNNICFGIDSSTSQVCSGVGNCTAPDSCVCQPSYFGNNCQFSDLFQFVEKVCNSSEGCKTNMTDLKICIDAGPSCYCNKGFGSSKVSCDSEFRITELSFSNEGFSGEIPNMLNFTALITLDLSTNKLRCSTVLDSILPSTIKSLNLSYNQISNSGTHYEVLSTYFSNFQMISMEGNSGCGVYPSTWLTKQFGVSTKNHQKSYWCDQLDSNACKKLQLNLNNYIMLPHETSLRLNYSTSVLSECKNILDDAEVHCVSTKLDGSVSKEFAKDSASIFESFVSCPRNQYLSDIDQYLTLSWKYNSTLSERISTDMMIVNLPYTNILSSDRHLIYSDNTGKSQTIVLTCDQNITRYRKLPFQNVKCGIFNEGIFVTSIPVSTSGTEIYCTIPLNAPNTGEKKIILYESTQTHNISINSASYWLVDPKLTTPEIYHSYAGSIAITDSTGNLLPGKPSVSYKLNNTLYSIDIPCTFLSGNIQSCTKSDLVTYPGDILVIPLSFNDGFVVISTIQTVFYKKNSISQIYPTAALSGINTNVLITFNSSTLSSTEDVNYFCLSQTTNYTAVAINSTTISCQNIQSSNTETLTMNVYAVVGSFKMILNEKPFEFYIFQPNKIYPSGSIISLNGLNAFPFSYVNNIPSELVDSIECQLEDGSQYKAIQFSSNEFQCNITSEVHRNLTFWYRDTFGFRSKLSSNIISLYFLKIGTISFDASSKQFGNTDTQYQALMKLDTTLIPEHLKERVFGSFNGTTVLTSAPSTTIYNSSIFSTNAGYAALGLKFKNLGAYKVKDIHNTFLNQHNLKYSFTFTISTNFYLKYLINSQSLISFGEMKSNCEDVVVTFKGIEIRRNIVGCNTALTTISFPIQESKTGTIDDYSVFFGNNDAVAITVTSGTTYSATPTVTTPADTILTLNTNTLFFGFLKQFSVSKIDPVAALVTNSTITLWNDYKSVDYFGKVKFVVRYDSTDFEASFTGNLIKSNIFASSGKKINIAIWAVYTPSNDYVLASVNTIQFIFMNLVTTTVLYPFVDRFSNEITSKNSTIKIHTASNLFTDSGLFSSYVSGNSSQVSCFMEVTNLNTNAENVVFDLYMNASTEETNLNFILSRNNLSYVYFKEPIQFETPLTIIPELLFQNYSLNFSDPNLEQKVSYDSYRVKLIPEFSNSNPTKYIQCEFKSTKPKCYISDLSLTHTPMKLDYQMEVFSSYFNETSIFSVSANYFKDNITFNSELPFVGDSKTHSSSKFTATFNVTKKLHPSYSYFCRVFSEDIPITKDASNENIFTCSFNSRGIDEVVGVSFFINDSSVNGLGGIISTSDSTIQMVSLKFVPEFATFPDSTSLAIEKKNSGSFVVPLKYRSYTYRVISTDGEIFSCTVDGGGVISCMKNSVPLKSADIFSSNFRLQYNLNGPFIDIVVVSQGLILYENHEISNLFPLAALFGTDVNLTSTFDANALQSSLPQSPEFYCRYGTNSSQLATVVDFASMKCTVVFNDHKSTQIQLKSFFKAPSLSANKEIFITKNESNEIVYFLKAADISFSKSSQVQFFYTSTFALFQVNISTMIPSHLTEYIQVKLSDSSGYGISTNLTALYGNTHVFDTILRTTVGGRKDLTLWYKQDNYQFQLSNNSLEVIFATPSLITGLSPVAVILNRTTSLTIRTAFPSTGFDYGVGTEFNCKYGVNSSRYATVANATSSTNGVFTCDVLSELEETFYISIWMKAKGIERKLTTIDETFKVISSDYFTPSYGYPTGNQSVIILEYNRVVSNVTFQLDSIKDKYVFDCVKKVSSLYCTSPAVSTSEVPIFNSYAMTFTNPAITVNLSVPWIFYEAREILSYHPQVISIVDTTIPFNFVMNKEVSIKEGSLFLVFAPAANERKDINLGAVQNTINITTSLTPLVGLEESGTYDIQLYYRNLKSIEFRSMFLISQIKKFTVLKKSPIVFESNSNNIAYLNTLTNMTVVLQIDVNLLTDQKPRVQCKLGTSYVKTYYDITKPTEYICEVSSTIRSTDVLTLWYKDSSAYREEILISSNEVDVLFIDYINAVSVSPFASVSKTRQISLLTDVSIADIYGAKAQYQCEFNGTVVSASLNGKSFDCSITTSLIYPFSDYVNIRIKSPLTNKPLKYSKNQNNNTEFYFLNEIKTLSVYPFAQGHKINGNGFLTTSVTLELKEDLILSREVFCKSESNGDTATLSKAQLKPESRNIFTCNVEKRSFANIVEVLNITLWMNASSAVSFKLTSNHESYLFIREPVTWNSVKALNKIQNARLNFAIPQNIFNYQLSMIPNIDMATKSNVSCDYSGIFPSCSLSQSNLNTILQLPSHLNFTLKVYHKTSQVGSDDIEVDYLTYYTNMTLQHLKPYALSYYENQYRSSRVISNVLNNLNSKRFKFKCNFTQSTVYSLNDADFNIGINEYQSDIAVAKHFGCSLSTSKFKPNENIQLKLVFTSEIGDVELTNVPAQIQVMASNPDINFFDFSPKYGPASGGYQFNMYMSEIFPTSIYKNYQFSLGLQQADSLTLLNCTSDSSRINSPTCDMVSIEHLFSDFSKPKKIKLDLRMNNVKAFSLVPYITFYPQIKVKYVAPSSFIRVNAQSNKVLLTTVTDIKTLGSLIQMKSVSGGISQITSCNLLSSTSLECVIPQFSTIGTSDITLSLDETNYQTTNASLTIYDDSKISISSVSTTDLSHSKSTQVYVIGNGFFNSPEIYVEIYDESIKKISKALYVNSTHLVTYVEPFYDVDVVFPRSLSFKLTFDGGFYYFQTSMKFKVIKSGKIIVSPELVSIGVLTNGISFSGFPAKELSYNETVETLQFSLISNQSSVGLSCNDMFSICNTSSVPSITGTYKLLIKVVNKINSRRTTVFLDTNEVKFYDFSEVGTISVQPATNLLSGSQNAIKVTGKFASFKAAIFKFSFVRTIFATVQQFIEVQGTLTTFEASVIPPSIGSTAAVVEISFNGGLNYHPVNTYTKVLQEYTVTKVAPTEQDGLDNFFATRNISSAISGDNFDPTGDLKIILKNEFVSYDLSTLSKIEFDAVNPTKTIKFVSPLMSELNIPYDVLFPFTMQLGVSFNGGYDYKYTSYVYVNSFPQAVFTGISPIFTTKKDFELTIFGLDFQYADKISFYDEFNTINGSEIFETKPYYKESNSTIFCQVPQSIMTGRNKIKVNLKNAQGEQNSNILTILFYEEPTLLAIQPSSGPSYGNTQYTILGLNITETIPIFAPEIYCRFGNLLCPSPCEWKNQKQLICTAPSHPAQKVTFEISYNKIDWHSLNRTKFEFQTCSEGYTADNYKTPCTLCPPGTFKPSSGLYSCIACKKGTYNSFSGATSCLSCPANTSSIIEGASSFDDCLCEKGFFLNHEFTEHAGANKKCVACPEGAYCGVNTTQPLALPGYWNSKTNYFNFYACTPTVSCGGHNPENCTSGYQGVRCGQCLNSWYKFRGKCSEYENDDLFTVKVVPWDVDYEYKPMNFMTDTETPEENFSTMNDVFAELLSWKRISRKLFLVKRKGTNVSTKIVKKFKKKTEEEKELDEFMKQLKKDDPEFQKKMKKYTKDNKMTKEMEKELIQLEMTKRKDQFAQRKSAFIDSQGGSGGIDFDKLSTQLASEEKKKLKQKSSSRAKIISSFRKFDETVVPVDEIKRQEMEETKRKFSNTVTIRKSSRGSTRQSIRKSGTRDMFGSTSSFVETNEKNNSSSALLGNFGKNDSSTSLVGTESNDKTNSTASLLALRERKESNPIPEEKPNEEKDETQELNEIMIDLGLDPTEQ
eukprot:gene1772-541_t